MITQEQLKELLSYNPETGIFTWSKSNIVAGCTTPAGYIAIMIKGSSYQAHRLAWLYMTGSLPKQEIDHVNGVRADNRLSNIRSVSRTENMRNKKMPSHNTSGCTGVTFHKGVGKWVSRIGVKGKRVSLGYFENIEDAQYARKEAEIKYGFHVNHGRIS